ncbi:MAG: phospholipase [Frankia sp.]
MRLRPFVPSAFSRLAAAPRVAAPLAAVALVVTAPLTASAATGQVSAPPNRSAVLSSWTQPTATSYAAWVRARADQRAWAAYGFDWNTDYCTDSPDRPFGFDFTLPCARHDFGHRNYAALGQFTANKARIDTGFYDDMVAVCAHYGQFRAVVCRGVALTYYEAVRTIGLIVETDRPARAAGAAAHPAA